MCVITADSPILAPSIGTLEQALRFADRDPVAVEYLQELWRLCSLFGMSFSILAAQSAHETAGWTSYWWKTRRNPAGLGITGDPNQDAASPAFSSGKDAARAHVAHMLVYTLGASQASALWRQVLGRDIAEDDPRYRAVIAAGWAGTVRTIRDLTGKWATDPQYHGKIVRWLGILFGEPRGGAMMAENVVFGRVPKPNWIDQYIEKPAGHGYGDYGPRRFRGVVLHRMAGTLLGTRSHFRATSGHGLDALTDWGIGGALDGDLDGVIDRYNDPDGRRSPWASGPAISPDGKLLVNGDAVDWYRKYALSDPVGVNIFNRDTEAIELSGQYDTPVTEKQYRALVQLIAWRLDSKMKLPWYVWPKNHDGVQAILWHGEVMGWTKPCPGQVVIAMTDRLINDVRDYLRRYQEQAAEVPQPQPPAQSPRPARPEDDPEVLKSWFGRLQVDGRTLTYSPKAAENPASISAIWRAHGEATGFYPRIAGYSELPDGTRVYEFDGGWRIIDPAGPAKPRPAGGSRP
jgi:hypothetical protein